MKVYDKVLGDFLSSIMLIACSIPFIWTAINDQEKRDLLFYTIVFIFIFGGFYLLACSIRRFFLRNVPLIEFGSDCVYVRRDISRVPVAIMYADISYASLEKVPTKSGYKYFVSMDVQSQIKKIIPVSNLSASPDDIMQSLREKIWGKSEW